jgi:hypothetical protein
MALAVRADVRGLGVKLAHKFVTVESIPLLGDNFWKQLQVSNFFSLSCSPGTPESFRCMLWCSCDCV